MTTLMPFGRYRSKLEQEFWHFHAQHPEVYTELKRLAYEAKEAGAQRIGMRMLWEVMRWNFKLKKGRDNSDYKFNDHLPPYYARLLMQQEKPLRGIFETRRVKAI